jgi:hypothetical protein
MQGSCNRSELSSSSTSSKSARKSAHEVTTSPPLSSSLPKTYTVEIGGPRGSGDLGFLSHVKMGEYGEKILQLRTENGLSILQEGNHPLTTNIIAQGVPFVFGETKVRIRTECHLNELLLQNSSSSTNIVSGVKADGRRTEGKPAVNSTIPIDSESSSSFGLGPVHPRQNKLHRVRFKYFRVRYRRWTASLSRKRLSRMDGVLEVDLKLKTFTIHTRGRDYVRQIKGNFSVSHNLLRRGESVHMDGWQLDIVEEVSKSIVDALTAIGESAAGSDKLFDL